MKRYLSLVLLCSSMYAMEPMGLGDAVMTGFSGVVTPENKEKFPQEIKTPKRTYMSQYNDELFIDTNGTSLVVKSLATDEHHLWDASVLDNKNKLEIKAKKIGQVFGLALDDAKVPNIYATATSFYGLNIVTRDLPNKLTVNKKPFITNDVDTRPERQVRGRKYAIWMQGQFGKDAGAGTVWKIDGSTGKVSKFTGIKLDGIANAGAALGNIAFDASHRQFFVSDLDTGMIHRISMNGKDLGHFDHGVTARKLHHLKPIIHNAHDRADITSKNFDATNVKTWGYTREGRRVYGLTVTKGRLFYAVYNGKNIPSEIWSMGLDKKGNFTNDSRFEVRLKHLDANLPVTDMIVTNDGQMILSQRPLNQGSYAMNNFIEPTQAQTVRYHLKVPQDGKLDRWYTKPQEYSVGFETPYRQGLGGISVGYNYDRNGSIDTALCNKSLWVSGEALRKSREFDSVLGADGSGVQGMPLVLSSVNRPAWHSLFAFYPRTQYESQGYIGDVEVYQQACVCECDEVAYVSTLLSPQGVPLLGGSNTVGGATGTSSVSYPPNVGTPTTGTPTTGIPSIGTPICFPWCFLVDCWTMPSLPFCNKKSPHEEDPKSCMVVETSPPGPFEQNDGTWQLPLYGIQSLNGGNIDSMKITPVSGVTAITNGPVFAVGTPLPSLSGVVAGRDAIINLCGFDSTKVIPGEPFECCNMKVKFHIGQEGNQTMEVVR